MRHLLDTNVLSDARRRRSPRLERWIAAQPVGELAISAVTILELERGIRRLERSDAVGARPLRRWLDDDVMSLFDGRILPVDARVAAAAAALHVPDPMPEMDALIAATALARDLTLVTRNVDDFRRTTVRVLDPSA